VLGFQKSKVDPSQSRSFDSDGLSPKTVPIIAKTDKKFAVIMSF